MQEQRSQILSGVVTTLLSDLKSGAGDKDRRRQVEEWMRTLAEKYPEFRIEVGLRDYYLAEAERLRADFDKSSDLTEKLGLGEHRVVPRSRRRVRPQIVDRGEHHKKARLAASFRSSILGAQGRTRTGTDFSTRPSNVRVYQFRHLGWRSKEPYFAGAFAGAGAAGAAVPLMTELRGRA